MKKIIIFLILSMAMFIIAVSLLARNAPYFIRTSLENALHKKIKIGAIDYRFPLAFELGDFSILETEPPFVGETLFSVDHVFLKLSLLTLSQKVLIIDELAVQNADIFVRKRQGRVSHVFSARSDMTGNASVSGVPGAAPPKKELPLEIKLFTLSGSRFKFMDYDAKESGFVFGLDDISGEVHHLALPSPARRTQYDISAAIPQGREQAKGFIRISGWTAFESLETDANLTLRGLYLPYFRSYYGQVTQAAIAEGSLDAKAFLRIQDKNLASDAELEIRGLLFEDYESGNQLFGLRAEEILSFLKDSSGRLKFQVSLHWNIPDKSVRPREVIRRGIEQSLKSTVLGNVGHLLENTLKKIDEQGVGRTKEDIEGAVKKIKDFLKY